MKKDKSCSCRRLQPDGWDTKGCPEHDRPFLQRIWTFTDKEPYDEDEVRER